MLRQTQTDTALLLSSKELSDANDKLEGTVTELSKEFE